MATIRIAWRSGEVTANLKDTPTAKKLPAALPCKASADTWGKEVYFSLPVRSGLALRA